MHNDSSLEQHLLSLFAESSAEEAEGHDDLHEEGCDPHSKGRAPKASVVSHCTLQLEIKG